MSDRTRTVSWHDPEVFKQGASMNGVEFLTAILDGRLPRPPIAELLGFVGLEVEKGRVVFEMKVGEYHYSPLNTVHGGITATLLDTVMGCAVQSVLDAGGGYTTTDLHIRYLRAATIDSGTLRAEGTVVHQGSRVVTAEGRVTDSRGKLIATGTTGCLLLPRG